MLLHISSHRNDQMNNESKLADAPPITQETLNAMHLEAISLRDTVHALTACANVAIGAQGLGWGRCLFGHSVRNYPFRGTMTGIRFPGSHHDPILIPRDIPKNRVGAVVTAMSMGFNGQKYGSKKPTRNPVHLSILRNLLPLTAVKKVIVQVSSSQLNCLKGTSRGGKTRVTQ